MLVYAGKRGLKSEGAAIRAERLLRWFRNWLHVPGNPAKSKRNFNARQRKKKGLWGCSINFGQWGYGATAARLTPDQKVGSTNLSGLTSAYIPLFFNIGDYDASFEDFDNILMSSATQFCPETVASQWGVAPRSFAVGHCLLGNIFYRFF